MYDHNRTYEKAYHRFPLPSFRHRLYGRADRDIVLGTWYMKLGGLKKMVRLAEEWYTRSFYRTETIILRNRRDKKPDVFLDITFHRRRDEYFEAAYSMRFTKDFEDGLLVIHTAREGLSQETILFYWGEYRVYGMKKEVHSYLDKEKHAGRLAETIQQFITIAQKWNDEKFHEIILSYLDDYIQKTLYADYTRPYSKHTTSLERLQLFIETDPLLADHIWKSNFSSKKSRQNLADALQISLKNHKMFIEADSIDSLRHMIERKIQRTSTVYDNLPSIMKKKIMEADAHIKRAKKGRRVGIHGVYIDSQAIDIAQKHLHTLWKDADRWIHLNKKNV